MALQETGDGLLQRVASLDTRRGIRAAAAPSVSAVRLQRDATTLDTDDRLQWLEQHEHSPGHNGRPREGAFVVCCSARAHALGMHEPSLPPRVNERTVGEGEGL